MWMNGIECHQSGCYKAISLDWPVGMLKQGWAIRSDKRYAACPEHTKTMPGGERDGT